MADIQVQTGHILHLILSTSMTTFTSERRLEKSLTIAALKSKLEMITGAMAPDMRLEIFSKEDKFLFKLDDADRLLGSYQIDDGMRLHVVNTNSNSMELFDVSKVQKYEMSEGNYSNRKDTVRSFLMKTKSGKYNPEEQKLRQEREKQIEEEEKKFLEEIKVGQRCEVTNPKQMARRGCVKFVGYTDFKAGLWVGVAYDEPYGKNDGSIEGKRYFECQPGYGAFVRPKFVQCGDFPELELDDDEEM